MARFLPEDIREIIQRATKAALGDTVMAVLARKAGPPKAVKKRAAARAVEVSRASRKIISFQQMIEQVANRYGARVAAEWTRSVLKYQKGISLSALESAIASGNLRSIESAIGAERMQAVVQKALERPLLGAAIAAGKGSEGILRTEGVELSFVAAHPNVVMFARQQAAELVVDVAKQVKQIIAEVIARGAEGRITVQEQARAIRELVGLPPNWAQAPRNFADELRRGDISSATSRRISAATAQRIRSRANAGTINESFIRDVQTDYTKSLINLRAQTIARTESLRSANAGLLESWVQAQQQGVLPANTRRWWIVTPDARLSITHARIPSMNPKGRKLNEPFLTTEGYHMYPPSRPNCRCHVGLTFGPGRGAPPATPAIRRNNELGQAITSPIAAETPGSVPGSEFINTPWSRTPASDEEIARANARLDQLVAQSGDGESISLADVGIRQINDAWSSSLTPESLRGAATYDVPISKLGFTEQESVEASRVRQYIRTGGQPIPGEPTVSEIDGLPRTQIIGTYRPDKGMIAIEEGHHRVVAQELMGRKVVSVRVILPRGVEKLPDEFNALKLRKAAERVLRGPQVMPPAEADVRALIDDLATNDGISPKKIKIITNRYAPAGSGSGTGFGRAVGFYKDGKITLYTKDLSSDTVREVFAHESTHFKFDIAARVDQDLIPDIIRDWDKLSQDDGVTEYSRAHWRAAIEHKKKLDAFGAPLTNGEAALPVNETLAEMRAVSVSTGHEAGSARYKKLLERVDRAYLQGIRKRIVPKPLDLTSSAVYDVKRLSIRDSLPHQWAKMTEKERNLLTKFGTNVEREINLSQGGGEASAHVRVVSGQYHIPTKSVRVPPGALPGRAEHELGHAVDHALGAKAGVKSGLGFISDGDVALRDAIAQDLHILMRVSSDPLARRYASIMRFYKPEIRRTEVFADVYAAQHYATSARSGLRDDFFADWFPNTWKEVKRILKSQLGIS